jgi:hypothetical protein
MKKLLFLLIVMFIAISGFAQGDTTGRSELAYLFQPLNANNIPYGYLTE